MAIKIADNFLYQGRKPLDNRILIDTVADMVAMIPAIIYDGMIAYVKDTKEYYMYDSTNTVDPVLAKWRLFSDGQPSLKEYLQNTKYKKDDLVYLGESLARVVSDFTSDNTKSTIDGSFEFDIDNAKLIPVGATTEFKIYKSNNALDTNIDGISTLQFTDLVTTGITIDDIEVNQLVYDIDGTVAKVDSINIGASTLTVTTITSSGSGASGIYLSNDILNKTILGTTSVSILNLSCVGTPSALEINTHVYDSEGTVARVKGINTAGDIIDLETITISGKDYSIYRSTKELSSVITDTSILSFTDIITPMGTTIADLKVNQIVFDEKGTIAKIDAADEVNGKFTVTTMTTADNINHMPIAPDTKELKINNGGSGYQVGDIVETTETGVFAEITSVIASGVIDGVKYSTSTTQTTTGTGAIIDNKQVIYGGYGSNWAALSEAAVLVAQTLVDQFDYEVGYSFEITAQGTGYVVGDVVSTDTTGQFVKVTKIGTAGEILEVEYTRNLTATTSGTGAVIKATLDTNVFKIPDQYWNAGLSLFYLTNDDGASVQYYRTGDILVKYNAGNNDQVFEFTFNEVNGTITQKVTTAGGTTKGSSMKEYQTTATISRTINDLTIINVTDIPSVTVVADLEVEQLVYDIKGTVAKITSIDTTTGDIALQTMTISGADGDLFMPIAPDTKELKIKNSGNGYVVGDIIETTTTGIFATVDSVDANGSITQVSLSSATTQSVTGTGAIISYEQVIYGGYNNQWAPLIDAAVLNAKVVADIDGYEIGYDYTIANAGTGYQVGDIVATDIADVFIVVNSVGASGEITDVGFTRLKTPNTTGTGANITAVQNTDKLVIPDIQWNGGCTIFGLTNNDGASTEFCRTGDINTKYGVSENNIYKFEYDDVNGIITQTALPFGNGCSCDSDSLTDADIDAAILDSLTTLNI